MAIKVKQGGEYDGETYIGCDVHTGGAFPVREHDEGLFQGASLEELQSFLAEHDHDGAP